MRLVDSSRVTYGSRISERVWSDSNGQLVIRDAVLARCGSYDYLESEIIPGGSSQKIIKVYRDEKEVFDSISIASFENKPFCNDHPDDDVCPENVRDLQVGFIRDIRRGSGDLADCLIGDIIVTDPDVIHLIKTGKKRELSLGYNTQIVQGEDGKYYMTKIRGNHLALVDSGRAGNATIRDNNTIKNIKKGDEGMARKIIYKTLNRDKFINQLYDEDIVKIEELEDDDEVIENLPEDAGEEIVVEEITKPAEQPVGDGDLTAQMAEIKSMLQQILDLMNTPKTEEPVNTQDEELPVDEEKLPEGPVEQLDEDITADETNEDEPTLFDADEEVEEITEEEQTMEDEDEEDEDEFVQDSASNLYASLVGVVDHNVENTSEDINKSFKERYKKFGGKN